MLRIQNRYETILGLTSSKEKAQLILARKRSVIEKYREDFDAYVATIGYEEGQIQAELKNSAYDPKNPTEQEVEEAKLTVKNGMLVAMFIGGANNELFGDLKTELNNDFAKGTDNWPTNIDEAVQLMNAYKVKKAPKVRVPQIDTE